MKIYKHFWFKDQKKFGYIWTPMGVTGKKTVTSIFVIQLYRNMKSEKYDFQEKNKRNKFYFSHIILNPGLTLNLWVLQSSILLPTRDKRHFYSFFFKNYFQNTLDVWSLESRWRCSTWGDHTEHYWDSCSWVWVWVTAELRYMPRLVQ